MEQLAIPLSNQKTIAKWLVITTSLRNYLLAEYCKATEDQMKIGIPKEIKTNENRVSLVPAGVEALVSVGHEVVVESGAGQGSGFTDEQYAAAGAQIANDADAVWAAAELIVKVKEPIAPEWPRIRPGQVIFTYFHFAASEALTRAHLASGAVCIAYETVELPSGELPLLSVLRALTINPAKILGLHSGRLAKGAIADLVLFDPGEPWVVNKDLLRSRSKNTPFDESKMKGRVLRTLVAGETVYQYPGERN